MAKLIDRFFGRTATPEENYERALAVYKEHALADVYGKALSEESTTHDTLQDLQAIAGERAASRRDARAVIIKDLTEVFRGTVSFGVASSTGTPSKIIKSPYNYKRIDSFRRKESYFSRSIARQTETLLRNGYSFVSNDTEALRIVNEDLTMLQMHTGVALDQIIAKCVEHITTYGIVFLQKVRWGTQRSFMKFDGKTATFARFRFINPGNVQVYVDEFGNISSLNEGQQCNTPIRALLAGRNYRKTPGVSAADLVMGTIIDPGDDVFPEPPCFQMLDDILSLRSLEETVELLAAQCSSPLLHAKVGDADHDSTQPMITQIHNTLVSMAPNGFIVTPHYVKIEAINLQQAMADLLPLITHFKNRVLTGSGSSPISVGESDTANRASAQSIDDALSDRCMYIGRVIANMFTYNIIPDILACRGYGIEKIFTKDGMPVVTMEFNEMSIEKQNQKNNNATNLFQANAITHAEYRKMLKRPPLADAGRKDLFSVMFPNAKSNAAAISSQNQPANQHGSKTAAGAKAD